MEKITKQLQEVVKQKKQLATNLNVKGVSASQDETLNTLVPKVLSIVGGSGDIKLGTKEITEDGQYNAFEDGLDGYSSVDVNIAKNYDFMATFLGGGTTNYASIKMLGDVPPYAFDGLANIKEIDLTLSKEIGNSGLSGRSLIENIISPNPLIVGSYSFSACAKADGEITISEEQTDLGDNAFYNCQKLKINLHDKLTSVGKYCFYQCYNMDLSALPSLLTSVFVYTFYRCTSLKITELPVGITSISNYGFAYCSSIETLKIHNACKSIGNYAFRYCSGLKELEIGTGITSMNGSYNFGNCTALEKVTIHATTPPALASNSFYNDNALKEIRVPASALDTYKSYSNWSKYADIMVGIEGE